MEEEIKKKPFGIWSLVLGILSLVLTLNGSWIGFIACFVGIVLGVKGLSNEKKGISIAGLICSAIPTLIFLIALITVIAESGSSTPDTEGDDVHYLQDAEIENAYASPDSYAGKYIIIGGKVFGEPEIHEDETYFQMHGDPVNSGKNTIVHLKGNANVKSGDFVKVDGKIVGSHEYKNMVGGTVTALLIDAKTVTESSYVECCAPTIKEVVLDKTIEQHGYAVTVNKIEFAETETRLYLTVANNGKDNFSVYQSRIKVVQNQKQYEYELNFDADYEKLQTDLLPNTSTSGIVVFPAMDAELGLKIYCEGFCDDWTTDLNQYVFEY